MEKHEEDKELDLVDEEPSDDELKSLEELEEEELESEELDDDEDEDADAEEDDEFLEVKKGDPDSDEDDDQDEEVAPLVVGGFDDREQDEEDEPVAGHEDDEDDEDEDDGDLAIDAEEDLTQLLDERMDTDGPDEAVAEPQKSTAKQEESWHCEQCFLLVSASQFGSPKNPSCPSDEADCPLLKKVRVK